MSDLRTIKHELQDGLGIGTTYEAAHTDGESVAFWIDPSVPGHPALAIDFDYPGREHTEPLYVPVESAHELARAILASIPE